jgi:hypothetical protein
VAIHRWVPAVVVRNTPLAASSAPVSGIVLVNTGVPVQAGSAGP